MEQSLENWPKTESGEPVAPALLMEAQNHQEVLSARMTLTAMGIPFLLENPNPAIFTTVLFGTDIIGGNLYVPETLLEDAKALLETPWSDDQALEGDEINRDEEC